MAAKKGQEECGPEEKKEMSMQEEEEGAGKTENGTADHTDG